MDKRTSEKIDLYELRFIFSTIILGIVLLLEIYIMINEADNILLVVGVGVLLLFVLFFEILSFIKGKKNKDDHLKEQYEDIFRSEKATYLLLRKNFGQLEEEMQNFIEQSKLPVDEIIEADKAMVKVMMNRARENTTAFLNSNDYIVSQLQEFQVKITEMQTRLEAYNQNNVETVMALIEEREINFATQIQRIEQTVIHEISQLTLASMKLSEQTEQGKEVVKEDTLHKPSLAEEFADFTETENEILTEVSRMESEIIEEKQEVEDVIVHKLEEEAKEEIDNKEEDLLQDKLKKQEEVKPISSDPNKIMSPDEIAALIASM